MTIAITVLPSGTAIIEVEGKVQTFTSEAEAKSAISVLENGAEFLRLATEYTEFKGLEGKNAQGKVNVVSDYLAWVDAGMPAPAPAGESTDADADADAPEAPAEVPAFDVQF